MTTKYPDLNPLVERHNETDPRFADYRTWLGSDYMLNALSLDPTYTMKRLGDGFYEQRLVREQVAALTGMRFLEGYANDEEQYRALMDNGITFARQHNLRPGVSLSAEQMAGLTSDIVWLVEKEVTLPDGTKSKVLAPQVYVRLREGDLLPSGALLAGQNIRLTTRGDVVNSGTIAGREIVALNAENIKNLGGRISGADVGIAAGLDLDNLGGAIQGQNSLTAVAGRDINVSSATSSQTGSQGKRTNISRLAGLYVTNPDGLLVAGA
ncbi:S-layer family protein, partial [bacterium]